MCGIFAYQGNKQALPILQRGLERLEYRGYDSAGVCVMDAQGSTKLIKSVGKVSELESKISKQTKGKEEELNAFTRGIAHTRWATHGVASEVNTHPHHDAGNHFYVIHNGIIENHAKLKKQLREKGYTFYSQTDSEVVPALLAEHWTGDLLETVEKVLPLLHGAYALVIMTTHAPNEIVALKRGSPLILGTAPDGFYCSSDMQALAGYATQTVTLSDGELVYIKNNDYIIKAEGKIIKKDLEKLDIKAMDESRGEYETFMRKEIDEQPAIIRRAFMGRVNFDEKAIHADATKYLKDKEIQKVVFVGCGTSYNAGQMGALWMQNIAGIDASAKIASEYMHQRIPTDPKTLHVFLSQSGETADSIEVLKHIKDKGGLTFGIVNVVGSTIATMTDCGFFLRAGYEIGVASTKAFTAQMINILMLTLFLGKKGSLSYDRYTNILHAMKTVPSLMEQIIAQEDAIANVAKEMSRFNNMFFLGRKYEYVVADEGSLKLKELSYIHSESYPAGELKHGPLALIEESFPCVLIAPHDGLFEQNMSSMAEIQSRKGKVLVVSNRETEGADRMITIPSAHPAVMPFLTTMVVQLLSYHVAKELGRDIDKPRNLAKSVTVK